jgi:hypothetical protein
MASRAWRVCVRTAKVGVMSLMPTAASIATYCGLIRYAGNVRVVEKGKLYRSAQLEGRQLAQVIAKYGIRSILNLRGAGPGQPWYDGEILLAKDPKAAHFDYGHRLGLDGQVPLPSWQCASNRAHQLAN